MNPQLALKSSAFAIVLTLGSSALLTSCGNDSDSSYTSSGDNQTPNPAAPSITTENAVDLFRFAQDGVEPFSDYFQITALLIEAVSNGGNDVSTDLCQSHGSASVDFTDTDNSNTITEGDSIVLYLDECNIENDSNTGTIKLDVINFNQNPIFGTFDITMDVNGTYVDQNQNHTFRFQASMREEATSQDGNQYNVRFTPIGKDLITETVDGQTNYKMGCFDINLNYPNVNNSMDTFSIDPNAVLVDENNQVLSVRRVSALSFDGIHDAPMDGTFDLYSGTQAACDALGLGQGGVSGDGSWMRMTSSGDGVNVNLQVYDQANNPVGGPISIAW